MRGILGMVEWWLIAVMLGMLAGVGLVTGGGGDGWMATTGMAVLSASSTWFGVRMGRSLWSAREKAAAAADFAELMSDHLAARAAEDLSPETRKVVEAYLADRERSKQ